MDQPPVAEDPKETTTADNELRARPALRARPGRLVAPARAGARRGPLESRDRGRPRRVHPVRPLRPGMRRHPGQRRDRPLRQGLRHADRVRPQRPDGRVVVRDLRRVRRRVPDRRATNKPINDVPIRPREELRQVESVCPYCGVGCALTFNVDDERGAIAYADGREQPGSRRRLCVKGRYGWDYSFSKQRLTTPLIRRESSYPTGRAELGRARRRAPAAAQAGRLLVDYDEVMPHFREATWDEALDLVASRLQAIHEESGPKAIAGFRVGQVLQRGGLPLPEADPRRLRHQQRRPLHAPVPRVERRGTVRGRRLWRGLDDVRRRRQRRRRDPRGHQHDRQPPGRVVVLQAGRRRGTRLIVVDPRRDGSRTTRTSTASSSRAPTSRSTTA